MEVASVLVVVNEELAGDVVRTIGIDEVHHHIGLLGRAREGQGDFLVCAIAVDCPVAIDDVAAAGGDVGKVLAGGG